MKKILVPVDGSDNSLRALMLAKEIGAAAKADISILHVANDFKNHPYAIDRKYVENLRAEVIRASNKIVDEACLHFTDYPGHVECFVRSGNVETEILRVGNNGEYDLIVIGQRGLGRFAKTMLGSTSQKILNHSDISVIIAK